MITSSLNKILKLFLIGLFLSAALIYSQVSEKKISVYFQNAPLTQVLKFISDRNSINFVYNQKVVYNKKVSCKFQNTPLIQVLDDILEGTGLKIGYQEGNLITLIEIPKPSYDISGVLIDLETGEPLPYANIKIVDEAIATTTDLNGRFSFLNLNQCNIQISAKYIGYNKRVLSFNCQKEKNIEIQLSKSPFILRNVEVIDSKNEFIEISNTAGLFAVSPRSYDNLPIFTSPDLIRTLQLLPGITSNGGGNAEIYIRGGIPSENLMTLDGLQLYHLNHFFGFFSSLSSKSIKDIRIFKSGFPARYGSKISGVIDMSSKNGSLLKPKIDIGINNLNLNLAAEIPLSKNLSFFISGRKVLFPETLYDNYKNIIEHKVESDTYIGAVEFNDDPKVFFADLFTKITYLPSNKDVVTASLLFTEDNHKINFNNHRVFLDESLTSIISKTITNNIERNYWVNRGLSFNWFRAWSSRVKSNLTFSTSAYDYDYDYKEYGIEDNLLQYEFFQKNNLSHSTLNGEVNIKYSNFVNIDLGFSYNRSDIKYKNILFNDDDISSSSDESPTYLAVFAQNEAMFFDKLNLKTGIRYTYNELTNKFYFEPRILASYKLNNLWTLKSSLGKYYQFVVKNIDGNSHLNGNVTWVAADDKSSFVSDANNFSFGVKYENKDLIFDIEYFYNKRENVFAFPSLKNVYYDFEEIKNKANGITKGFEVQLIKKTGKISGWISYAYNKSEFSTILGDLEKKFIPDNNTPNSFKFVLQYNFPSINISIVTNYSTGKPYTIPELNSDGDLLFPENINTHRLKDNLRIDLSVVKKFDFDFFKGEIGISLYNVLDSKIILNRFYYRYYYQYLNNNNVYVKKLKSDQVDFRFTPSFFINLNF